MRAVINRIYRIAYIQTDDVDKACFLGKKAIQDYSDIFNHRGWGFYCVPTSLNMRRDDRQEADVGSLRDLVKLVQEENRACAGFVGPFGEGSDA